MQVLVLNCGSSTVKFQLLELGGDAVSAASIRWLARGMVDRFGADAMLRFESAGNPAEKKPTSAYNHGEAVEAIFGRLKSDSNAPEFDVVAHRVVHGGDRFRSAVVIDESVIDALEALCELAPLHNPPSLAGIQAARSLLGSSVTMVAAFDTSFHRTIPDYAATYGIPHELASKHKIRRYGFHGFAHKYSAVRYREITGAIKEDINIITLHLGNGCSACAIRGGESVDTSMGFTPLEGLMMGTRSGDIDPALVAFLTEAEGVEAGTVEKWLNERAGLLGISEISSDMRDLVSDYDKKPRARLAVEVFCYRARKYLGAYLAVLGGAQAVVFSGGIGENSPFIREKICDGMDWCGLRLDKKKNAVMVGGERRISNEDALIHIFVIPSNEEAVMAREAAMLLAQDR
ncbi:MAG TPA: acetate kinase [Candidatus Binatia bacterium]|nr:acetate kinase [Candidatus Binatia bacterium]